MMRLVGVCMLAACLIGCARHLRHATIHDTLAQLPDGGEIVARWDYEGDPPCASGPVVSWTMPGQQTKRLITLMPTTGSPTLPPDRLPREPLANTKRHDVGNGRRVWLESNGRAVASFDYDAALAVIGPYGQPDWARMDARPLPGE